MKLVTVSDESCGVETMGPVMEAPDVKGGSETSLIVELEGENRARRRGIIHIESEVY